MKKILKLSPYILSLALLSFFFLASLNAARLDLAFYGTLGVSVIASAMLLALAFSKRRPIAPELLPALLAASSFFAMIFVEEIYLRLGISILTAILFFIIVKQMPSAIAENYYTDLLRAIAEWSILLAVFFLGAGLAAAMVFLNFSQVGGFLVFLAAIFVMAFILHNLSPAPSLVTAFAFVAILAECFWVVNLFPFSYWVNAGFLAAAAYIAVSLVRGATARDLKRAAAFAAVAVLLLFGSARWR